MTITVGAGGGSGLIMPTLLISEDEVTMNSSAGTRQASNAAAFWTAIDLSHTDIGYESVSLTPAIDTTEQTIVDITGQSGVLTSILSSSTNVSPTTYTIRVTIDGELTTFTAVASSTLKRFLVGDFLGYGTTGTVTNGVGIGGSRDDFSLTTEVYLPTPITSILSGRRVGMPFNNSLKVTQQLTQVPFASGNGEKCLVNYSLLSQEGY